MIKTFLFLAAMCLAWFVAGTSMGNGEYLLSAVSSVLAVSLFVWSRGKFLSRIHTHFNYAFFIGVHFFQFFKAGCTWVDLTTFSLLALAWYFHWKIPSHLMEAK